MPKMGFTAAAMDLGPLPEQRVVGLFANRFGFLGLKERRPACARLKLVSFVEKLSTAADTCKRTFARGEILVGAGTLGRLSAGHPVGKIIQLLAPFGIRLDDFFHLLGLSVNLMSRRNAVTAF